MGFEAVTRCRVCADYLDVYQPYEERFCSEECMTEQQRIQAIELCDKMLAKIEQIKRDMALAAETMRKIVHQFEPHETRQ